MPSVFTRIIDGELPAEVVWRDERAIGFLSKEALQPGHTLIVPLVEVDDWLDLDADLAAHLLSVAQHIGQALRAAFGRPRVAVVVLGFGIPHVHLHLVPVDSAQDLRFAEGGGQREATSADLAVAAGRIREALSACRTTPPNPM
jgi:histidine triad (HIT) family protein